MNYGYTFTVYKQSLDTLQKFQDIPDAIRPLIPNRWEGIELVADDGHVIQQSRNIGRQPSAPSTSTSVRAGDFNDPASIHLLAEILKDLLFAWNKADQEWRNLDPTTRKRFEDNGERVHSYVR